MKVLVVDDSPTMRRIVINALQRIGYADTIEAPDGLTALGKLNSAVGLIITDWSMPEMSGPEFTRAVRAHPNGRSVPILMVTTRGARDEIISAVDAGVTSYIHKPFTPADFRDVIARIAKKKGLVLRREDELHAAIGRQIRELRKTRSLTLKQMARRTNLSVSLLSQIERAESSASVSSLFKVATALDVRLTDLFAGY